MYIGEFTIHGPDGELAVVWLEMPGDPYEDEARWAAEGVAYSDGLDRECLRIIGTLPEVEEIASAFTSDVRRWNVCCWCGGGIESQILTRNNQFAERCYGKCAGCGFITPTWGTFIYRVSPPLPPRVCAFLQARGRSFDRSGWEKHRENERYKVSWAGKSERFWQEVCLLALRARGANREFCLEKFHRLVETEQFWGWLGRCSRSASTTDV